MEIEETKTDSKPVYHKVCKRCKKEFTSSSRGQRFCCTECQKKAHKRVKARRKDYDQNKEIQRLSSRFHSAAVALIEVQSLMGERTWECEHPGCDCNLRDKLEVHHINGLWWDNSPENLKILCVPHHAEAHTTLKVDLPEGSASQLLYKEYLKTRKSK